MSEKRDTNTNINTNNVQSCQIRQQSDQRRNRALQRRVGTNVEHRDVIVRPIELTRDSDISDWLVAAQVVAGVIICMQAIQMNHLVNSNES